MIILSNIDHAGVVNALVERYLAAAVAGEPPPLAAGGELSVGGVVVRLTDGAPRNAFEVADAAAASRRRTD